MTTTITTFYVIKMPVQAFVWRQLPVSSQVLAQELCSCISPGLSQEKQFFPCFVVSHVQTPPAICPSNICEHFALSFPPCEAEDMMKRAMAITSVPGWKEWKGKAQVHNLTQGLEGDSLPPTVVPPCEIGHPEGLLIPVKIPALSGFHLWAPLSTFPPREPSSEVT